MKRVLSFVALASLLFSVSCAQQGEFFLFSVKSDSIIVSGVWTWVSSDGGISNMLQTPGSTGQAIVLQLTNDHHYSFYTNNTVTEQGTYTITNVESFIDNGIKPALTFSNKQTDQIIEILNKDTLKLADNAYDGVETLYVR